MKILSHAQKAGSLYLLGVLFKISDEHTGLPFYMEIPPRAGAVNVPGNVDCFSVPREDDMLKYSMVVSLTQTNKSKQFQSNCLAFFPPFRSLGWLADLPSSQASIFRLGLA